MTTPPERRRWVVGVREYHENTQRWLTWYLDVEGYRRGEWTWTHLVTPRKMFMSEEDAIAAAIVAADEADAEGAFVEMVDARAIVEASA